MSRRGILLCGLILVLVPAVGCFNSESDYERLVEENKVLSAELATAKRENEILNQALDNIKEEQEKLQILLNTSSSNLADAGSSDPGSAPPLTPLSGDAPAFSWGGWDWTPPPDALPDPPATESAGAGSSSSTAGASSGSSGGDKIYSPRSGDTLYTIARRHNTTLEELLELNPQLRRRNNYMIWETDKIKLP